MATNFNLWQQMATFGNKFQLLVTNANFWQQMATFGNKWFSEKSNRPASEQILQATPMDERMMCACVGQNKRWKVWYRQKNLTYLGLTVSWSSNQIFDRHINGWEISSSVFGMTRCTRLYIRRKYLNTETRPNNIPPLIWHTSNPLDRSFPQILFRWSPLIIGFY